MPRAAADPRRARAGRRAGQEHPELAEMLDQLADGIPVEGMEAFAPVLIDEMVLLIDELPAGAHIVVVRPGAGPHPCRRPDPHLQPSSWRRPGPAASVGGAAPIDLGAAAYQPFGEVRTHARPSASRGGPSPRSPPTRRSTGAGRRQPAGRCQGAEGLPRRHCPARSTTSRGWLARRLAGRCSSPRATVRPSGSPRCCATPTSGSASSVRADEPSAHRPSSSTTASSTSPPAA